ncbi:MAG: hypothetical protein JNK18_13710 [Cyclobacteriaceae bacterium]|nr:hypothetical protein [Cyclobacteriaceae bacterium]
MGQVATDLIQLTSLPLEIVGFVLTIIEIFNQEKHLRIQKQVVGYLERTDTFFNKYNRFKFWLIGFCMVVPMIVGLFVGQLPDDNPYKVIDEIWLFLFTGWFAATVTYNIFSKLLPDKKLLAFGLALTTFGIMGEIFQVMSIFE